MDLTTTMVCLARSRKHGSYCVAGKTLPPSGRGRWIRPTGAPPGGALREREITLACGSLLSPLDIITVSLQGKDSVFPHQGENYRIAPGAGWVKRGTLAFSRLEELEDRPGSLWKNGCSSRSGINDYVPCSWLKNTVRSICLIRPENMIFTTDPPSPCRPGVSPRALFTYRGTKYKLKVTDPWFYGLDREQIKNLNGEGAFLTVSLGAPFLPEARKSSEPECYKLAAAVFLPGVNCR